MKAKESKSGFSREDRKKATKGTILSVFGGVVLAGVRALGFFLRAIFGGEAWGLYAIAWALTELLAFFILGGFNDAVVLFASRAVRGDSAVRLGNNTPSPHQGYPTKADPYQALGTIIRVPFLAALLTATVVQVYAPEIHQFFWREHDVLVVEILQTLVWTLPLLVLVQIPVEATRATLRFGFAVGIVQIAFPLLSLLCAIVLFYCVDRSILAVAQGAVLALCVCLPASIYAYSRHFDLVRTLRACVYCPWDREVLSFALPQSLNMMLNQGLVRMDSLMLSFFGVSANTVGIYSLVGDLTQLVRLAKMAFSGVFSPLVAKYRAENNRVGTVEALDDFVRKTSSLGVVLLIFIMSLWPVFIFTKNEAWSESWFFPWLLCAGPMMSCFFGLCGNTLLMHGHSRLLLFNATVSGLLNLVLNLLFIPKWGILGAASATACANITISCLQIYELRKFENLALRARYYWRTLTAAVFPIGLVFGATIFYLPVVERESHSQVLPVRLALTLVAVSIYVLLQLKLPGRRPFGATQ